MMMRNVWMVVLLVACGKSEPDYKQANPPPAKPVKPAADPGSAGSAGSAAPVEAAEVSGPTKSATGTVTLSGALTGTFEWIKKDQRAPITCVWDSDKEIGTLKIDLSDGAGKLVTIGLDVPPTEAGPGRLEIISKDLPASLKTYTSFRMASVDDPDHFTVLFDDTVAVTDPDAQMNKKKKPEPPPAGSVQLKGSLVVTCPKKK
jgi:hypothetical protein